MNTIASIEIKGRNVEQIAKNMRALLNEHGLTENEIAQSLNIPVMTIRRLVSGETTDPRISTLKLIADFFNVSVDSLIGDNASKSVVSLTKASPQFVPILDWETASAFDQLDLKEWKQWHPVVTGGCAPMSASAFALESRPSMQPRYPAGTLFIIDPRETPTDSDTVLIKLKADGSLSLRKLIIDAPRWQLQPVVLGSETFFYDDTQHSIVGVVILTLLHARKDK